MPIDMTATSLSNTTNSTGSAIEMGATGGAGGGAGGGDVFDDNSLGGNSFERRARRKFLRGEIVTYGKGRLTSSHSQKGKQYMVNTS